TSTDLVDIYTDRILTLDRAGPNINSIRALNTDVRDTAAELDHERARGRLRGPLHGLPFVVKDNFDVLGLPTTGGSAALVGSYPARNAAVVQQLIDAGAFVLATTNMSELAASARMYGYSSIAGWTRNPYNVNRTAYGSSSGTAAAVASRFAAFGLGTDTSGSVRAPASATGLFGLRPTIGTISHTGILPHARSLDMPGPLTVTARDTALVLSAMTGSVPVSPIAACHSQAHRHSQGRESFDHTTIGVIRDYFGANHEVDETVTQAIRSLDKHGAQITEIELPPALHHLADTVVRPLANYEFKADFESYLTTLRTSPITTLRDLIAVLESTPPSTCPAYPINPQRLRGLYEADEIGSSPGTPAARRHLLDNVIPFLRNTLRHLFTQNNVDILAFPTVTCTAPPICSDRDDSHGYDTGNPYLPTYLGSATGYPEITCPIGVDSQNLPIGMSLLGLPYTERELLDLACTLTTTLPELEYPNIVQ
ncbi:amidase, partial [Mycobacterium sp. NPDC003449]